MLFDFRRIFQGHPRKYPNDFFKKSIIKNYKGKFTAMCLRFKGNTKIWPWTINLQQSTEYQNYKPGLVLLTKRKCSQFSTEDKDVKGLTFFNPKVTQLGFAFNIQYNGVT